MAQCFTKTKKDRRAAQRVLICSEKKKQKVNKMDKVSGERLIRKVFLDYDCAADEINHV